MAGTASGANWLSQRDELVACVHAAADLEHLVCCQYLFSAFSMRTEPNGTACTWADVETIRGWRSTMLSIARQEMEHLAIVNNLLTALGEAPYFQRTAFPVGQAASPTKIPFELAPFGLESLGWYLLIELPSPKNSAEDELLTYLETSPLPADKALLQELRNPQVFERNGIVALYNRIEALLRELSAPGSPPLFVGPAEAQVGNAAVFPSFPPTPDTVRNYDVLVPKIVDLQSALDAIAQVRWEGEGGPQPPPSDQGQQGHFERFVDMYIALSKRSRAGPYTPARPVVRNPVAGTNVTNPLAVEAMAVYDLGYSTCLRLLTRFFASADPFELPVIQDAVFFPMMTLLLRPLGDVITQLLATTDPMGPAAGPSFAPPPDAGLQPHREAAFVVLQGQLDELRDRTATLATRSDVPPALRPRFAFLAENMWRLADNFRNRQSFGIPT